MDEKTRAVLMQVAGHLTMVSQGLLSPTQAKTEAAELLDKVGALLAAQSK